MCQNVGIKKLKPLKYCFTILLEQSVHVPYPLFPFLSLSLSIIPSFSLSLSGSPSFSLSLCLLLFLSCPPPPLSFSLSVSLSFSCRNSPRLRYSLVADEGVKKPTNQPTNQQINVISQKPLSFSPPPPSSEICRLLLFVCLSIFLSVYLYARQFIAMSDYVNVCQSFSPILSLSLTGNHRNTHRHTNFVTRKGR